MTVTIGTPFLQSDNVLVVPFTIPPGETYAHVVNIPTLWERIDVLLPGRVGSVFEMTNYDAGTVIIASAVVFNFYTPPTTQEQTVVSNAVAAHDPTNLTEDQQATIDRGADWADLRAQAIAMITQGNNAINGINANLTTLDSIATAVTAASTVPQLKAALAPLLTVQQAILNRQKGIIENFQRVLRALRWLVPSSGEGN